MMYFFSLACSWNIFIPYFTFNLPVSLFIWWASYTHLVDYFTNLVRTSLLLPRASNLHTLDIINDIFGFISTIIFYAFKLSQISCFYLYYLFLDGFKVYKYSIFSSSNLKVIDSTSVLSMVSLKWKHACLIYQKYFDHILTILGNY